MSNINKEYIEDYIREVIPENNEVFKEMEEYAKVNHIPIVHPEVAQFLKVMIKIKKPKKILEIGCAIGYSAMIMADAMDYYGEVTSIERRKDMVDIAEGNISKGDFQDIIHILQGEAQDLLPNIDEKFDLVFIDAAKGKYMEFLPYCIRNLKDEGIIISDNVLFKGMVANDDLVVRRKKTIVRRMREYLDYISNSGIFESSIMPLGDGVAISYKRRTTDDE
ncbi:O-methyltransferase [Clostridiisalibacter paucivorans]|uniref:O-methyltransferase n=1 Tax=Clostridiisalibacter paucivorans TaxID=408753 RepID=UPI00047C71E3|nr:O-methyltransferase [Clostridiisalibacter paucivorans]